MSDTTILLKENLLRDVEDLAREMDEKFTDEDLLPGNAYGLDLMGAAMHYTEKYNGKIDFMTSMKAKLLLYKKLSPAQGRAVLNIMRQEVRGETTPQPKRDEAAQCFVCKENFPSMTALLDHKERDHKGKVKVEQAPDGGEFVAERVVKNTSSALKLDLSSLPDGRYAVPNLAENPTNPFVYLMVRRVRKRVFRNRAYVYGKIISGKEWVEAGTIEVKEWSSDSKRLCGEQVPGGVYEGEYEVQLRAVLAGPEPWARLFGQKIGHCGMCGKTLTDEISQADGFGPECIKKQGYFTQRIEPKFERQYDSNIGRERVWCLEHKIFDCDARHTFFDLDDEV
jgi:hypothetical protein